MDQMAVRIHQRLEICSETEHWLRMESDAVQSQLLSFDVPLTFSAACFLLCFLVRLRFPLCCCFAKNKNSTSFLHLQE